MFVRGVTLQEYGLLQMIYYLAGVALEVPSGVVADRFGRKPTLLACALCTAAGCATMAMAHDFWVFAAGEILFALGGALMSGADSALLYDSLAAEDREAEYARAESASAGLWLLASAVGLFLADLLLVDDSGAVADPVGAYWVSAGMAVLAILCALGMVEPARARSRRSREITAGAVRDVWRIPGALRLIVYSVGVFILVRAAVVNLYDPAMKAMHIPVTHFGKILALCNAAGAVAAFLTPWALKRFGDRRVLASMPLSLLLMYAGLAFCHVPPAAAFYLIQGAAFGAYPMIMRTILNHRIPSSERRATVLSIEQMACRICYGIAAALIAEALGGDGLQLAIVVTILCAAIPFLLLGLARRHRGERAAEPPAA